MKIPKERLIAAIVAGCLFLLCALQAIQIGFLQKENKQFQKQIEDLEVRIVSVNDLTNQVKERVSPEEFLELYLPKDIFVASGITLELYNDEICFGINPEDYIFYWSSDIGDCMEDKFHYGANDKDSGEHELSVVVYDYQKRLVGKATTTLHVIQNQFQKDQTGKVRVLTIGDSFTSNLVWARYVRELSKNKIAHVGTLGSEPGLMHEGRMGFSAMNYLEGTPYDIDRKKVFTNPKTGEFDWEYYLKTSKVKPDIVQVFLGANGMSIDPTTNSDSIVEIVKRIREADPQIPIMVVQTTYPADQNGMARQQNVMGFQAFHGMWSFERCEMTFRLMVALDQKLEGMDNVYLVPAAISFDRQNGFAQELISVNPHSGDKMRVSAESIHPSEGGAKQIGDTIYSVLCQIIEDTNIGVKKSLSSNSVSASGNSVTPENSVEGKKSE